MSMSAFIEINESRINYLEFRVSNIVPPYIFG